MAEHDGPRPLPARRLSRAAIRRLRQPLDAALVSERANDDGELIRYLEGWRVIEQANAIFGHGGWGAEVVGEVGYRPLAPNGRGAGATACGLYTATVRVTVDGGRSHSDVGCAAVTERTTDAHSTAYKAAVTDALKRALRHWGDQFGNRLSARDEEAGLVPDELRERLLAIAASAGSDEAHTREWVAQRYGHPLDELESRPLLDAIGALTRGLDRRNGHASAA